LSIRENGLQRLTLGFLVLSSAPQSCERHLVHCTEFLAGAHEECPDPTQVNPKPDLFRVLLGLQHSQHVLGMLVDGVGQRQDRVHHLLSAPVFMRVIDRGAGDRSLMQHGIEQGGS
jgi:hypothetical protein